MNMSKLDPASIPFNRPCLVGNELIYINQTITAGWISGDGMFTKKCSNYLEQILNTPRVLLTTSCTHALELAALLLEVNSGDEVIIPSFTFVSTVNAFVLRGAHPVFVDIRPDTLNLDESQLEEKITPNTKAIILVHYAGVGCEIDTILEITHRYKIQIIEDNAHGLFGKYKGKYLGTFGPLATQSFHETKNFSCGEGGALVINDSQYIDRAEIIREKGTNRSRFFRGQVDKYSWIDIGSSYLPSDLLAAYLFGQLEMKELIQARRQRIWEYYSTNLKDWAQRSNIRQPVIPKDCQQSFHLYYLILPSLKARQALISHLAQAKIMSVFHYLPLHLSEMGRRFGGKEGDCPVTERVSDCLVRLPFYNDLSETDQERVVDAITKFSP